MNAELIKAALKERFDEDVEVPVASDRVESLAPFAFHGVCRDYLDRIVDPELIRLLCACAMCSPSKSDLQQRDIIVVQDPGLRTQIAELVKHMPWVRQAPAFLVFCLNANRLPRAAALQGRPFPNNHLDLFFNATGDAAIALAYFLQAAESLGLGTCPISEIRNHASAISDLLGLPERVIPFAGVCLGWPGKTGRIVPRLPLRMTVHHNRYSENDLEELLMQYNDRGQKMQVYGAQRAIGQWGVSSSYGWVEDKTRQYAGKHRADFGEYVRSKGFCLD
ncbi:nitroreductase family protein [Microvirga arabica]|uniref:nitroreductase family protein n=1 Tax=Microvirga arabica TaxID=1128671 RepID=UPI00193A8E07|nr:nitroreductase family protein [Microvirga arabica]MBM1173574.1 nitroreductase family protein [Microvirga arabica]